MKKGDRVMEVRRSKDKGLDTIEQEVKSLESAGILSESMDVSSARSLMMKSRFYHDTVLLLKHYRTMCWQLETGGEEVASKLEISADTEIGIIIDSVRDLIDLHDNTAVENRFHSL